MGSTALVLGAGTCATAVTAKLLHEGATVIVSVRCALYRPERVHAGRACRVL